MLIIGKREKGKVVKLYRSVVNEIESYTLLHLTVKEAHQLINAGVGWVLHDNKFYITHYKTGDKLDQAWKAIAHSHNITNPNFVDVHQKYTSKVSGTSVLLRDNEKHTITIAYKKKNKTCSINRLAIDNQKRQQFFRDCRRCRYLYKTNKWGIDMENKFVYLYWDEYMNRKYEENILEIRKEKKNGEKENKINN